MPNLAFVVGSKVVFEFAVCDPLQSREWQKMRSFEVDVGSVDIPRDYIAFWFINGVVKKW